jgi:hypothetical protein
MLLVKVLEHIFVLQVPEDDNDLLQFLVDLALGDIFQAFAQHIINIRAQVTRGTRVVIDEALKRLEKNVTKNPFKTYVASAQEK